MLLALALAIVLTGVVALAVPAWRRPAVAVMTLLAGLYVLTALTFD
jgi:hypothetical protein